MPAENDPAEPNALKQSLQLTCSLMPSSTVPSTRLVIIWLKRCPARPLIELPLESAPVTGGVLDSGVDSVTGVGEGFGKGELLGLGVGVGVLHSTPHSPYGVDEGDGDGEGDGEGSTAPMPIAPRAARARALPIPGECG